MCGTTSVNMYTGLGGNENQDDDVPCVMTGPFAHPGWTMTLSTGNTCLYRRFALHDRPADCTAVQDTMIEDFFYFHAGVERLLHDQMHLFIGWSDVFR